MFSVLSLNAQLSSLAHDTAALVRDPRLLQIVPASPGGLPEELAARLASDKRVAAVAPLIVARVRLSSDSRSTGAFALGGSAGLLTITSESSSSSTPALPVSGVPALLIGRGVAERLEVSVGDELTVHASTGATPMRVGGIVSSKAFDRINGGIVVAMPLATAQKVFGRTGRVDQLLLRAAPTVKLIDLRRDIDASLKNIGVVGSPGGSAKDTYNFAFIRRFTNLMGAFLVMAALMLVLHTMVLRFR